MGNTIEGAGPWLIVVICWPAFKNAAGVNILFFFYNGLVNDTVVLLPSAF